MLCNFSIKMDILVQTFIWIVIFESVSSNPKYCGRRALTKKSGSFGIFRNQLIPKGKRIICKWDITVEKGKVIELEFGKTKPKDCHFFYWDVFHVNIRQRFECRFSKPMQRVISSSVNTMRVKFYTDLLFNDTDGFIINYQAIKPKDAQNPYRDCGGIVSGLSGTIMSPGFPNNYSNKLKCRWDIIPDPEKPRKKHNFVLKFSFFKMEGSPFGEFLKIFIDKSKHSSRRFSGVLDLPAIEYSLRRNISIVFLSDHSVTNQGFKMTYTTERCNKKLKKRKGTISSPGFPGNYSNGIDCTYTIFPQTGFNTIELKFTHFDIEEQQNCIFDKLTIPNIVTGWRECGNVIPKTIYLSTAQGKPLKLKFHTDDSMTATGFKATYKHMNRSFVCGGLLTGRKGSFQSPNYPQPYPKSLNCTWKIVVPEGKMAELNFTEFIIWEPASYGIPLDCTESSDIMEIYIGKEKKSVGRFCKAELLPVITSPDNVIWVDFITAEEQHDHKGFFATYRAIKEITCGGVVPMPRYGYPTRFHTPGAPGFSHANTTCTWTLIAPTDHLAGVSFDDFRFTNEIDECDQHGHVLVYYGREETLLQRLCNKWPEHIMIAPGNIMTVKFVSREIDFVDSFIADSWALRKNSTDLPPDCNKQLTDTSGTIKMPIPSNRPTPSNRVIRTPEYQNNLNCSWTITVETNSVIRLNFEEFSLEFQKNCVFDYVEFAEEVVAVGFPQKNRRFCGRGFHSTNELGPPKKSTTKGNTMTIIMKTDAADHSTGFILNYKAIPSGKDRD